MMTMLPITWVDETARKGGRRHCRTPLLPKNPSSSAFLDGGEPGLDGASFPGAVFNLSTTIVGAGIMALPAAIKLLGLAPGLAAIVLVALLTRESVGMILRFGRPPLTSPKPGAGSYAGAVGEAFGCTGRALLQACIVVNNLGMLVVYMIIIGDVLSGTTGEGGVHHPGLVEEWVGEGWWATRSGVLLLTSVLVFAPLISLKRVDSLRYTSALSVALAMVFVVVTAGLAITKIADGSIAPPQLLPEVTESASFWKLFTTVPVLVTAYICHYSVHPIENELRERSQMRAVVDASMWLCAGVYVATSLFGFLLFGEKTLDDVLANFDGDMGLGSYGGVLSTAVRVSYAAHLMLVFPVVFFSLRLNLDGLLFPLAIPIASDRPRFAAITATLMGASFLGANFVPSIWDAFQFTGATAAIAIGFLFPAAMALRDVYGVAKAKDKVLAWVMILLGISSSAAAISTNIYDLFNQS
ncbi:hypothetical protein Taro_011912 [Colocasia esculenta]|uniref:Amino acid transporter transmembrane domain-containing protein n=1 Tax=Colocasia esculenta TaxID=4460 RepID=A0A843UC74_COLES|nr:hypothetical protein [Colocasia esculenta]